MIIQSGGSVGIGTQFPRDALEVYKAGSTSGLIISEWGSTNLPGQMVAIGGNETQGPFFVAHTDASGLATGNFASVRELFGANGFVVETSPATVAGSARTFTERMRVTQDGNVGIGTATPGNGIRLDVNGNAHVNGNMTVDGNLAAKYQDVAEWVPVSEPLTSGTVVVLNRKFSNSVMASAKAYDTTVAGVVSEQPGITLGVEGPDKAKIATTGRVRVKVDATRGPIEIGDLLVTGEKSGTAMRSQPIEIGGVKIHRPGTIIGKALEPLEGGSGEILVLLSLQ